jgi:hypothetical protein
MPRHAALVALALLAGTAEAAAADPGPDAAPGGGPALEVVGACPDVDFVNRLLGALLPGDEGRAAVASIQDRGPRYRIVTRASASTYDDPARDCAERARHAAIVIADEARPHPPVLGPPRWTIEKGVVYELAPRAVGMVSSWGAEFRGAFGSGAWSLVGAAGARGPVTLTFDGGWKAEQLRFPFDAGARLTLYRWRLRPWLVLGPSLTVNAFLGQDLVQTDRDWRVNLGALAMVGATLPLLKRIGVAAAVAVRWEPRPYRLDVVPAGKVGETPVWWIGISLNYTIDGEPSRP